MAAFAALSEARMASGIGVRQHDLTFGSQFGDRWQHGAKHFADGGKVVARDPVAELN